MVACTLLVTACGNGSIPAVGEGGPVRTIDSRSVDPGQGGTGGELDGGVDGGLDGGADAGACDNSADLDAITAANLNTVMTFCTGLACLNTLGDSSLYRPCVTACVQHNVSGLSSECADCYGGVARCGLDAFCFNVCQFNTCGLQCLNCLEFVGCLTEFEECRGIPGNDCNGGGLPFTPITDNQ